MDKHIQESGEAAEVPGFPPPAPPAEDPLINQIAFHMFISDVESGLFALDAAIKDFNRDLHAARAMSANLGFTLEAVMDSLWREVAALRTARAATDAAEAGDETGRPAQGRAYRELSNVLEILTQLKSDFVTLQRHLQEHLARLREYAPRAPTQDIP